MFNLTIEQLQFHKKIADSMGFTDATLHVKLIDDLIKARELLEKATIYLTDDISVYPFEGRYTFRWFEKGGYIMDYFDTQELALERAVEYLEQKS